MRTQVKFNIATLYTRRVRNGGDYHKTGWTYSSQGLPPLLFLAKRHIPSPLHDRNIAVKKRASEAFDPVEQLLPVTEFVANIVEKDASDPSTLASVFVVKIFVARLLEPRVRICERWAGACCLDGTVEVDCVFGKEIAGREVAPAAEPPDRNSVWFSRILNPVVSQVSADARKGQNTESRAPRTQSIGSSDGQLVHMGFVGA
jgi:hypothetical protein